jgi:T5SS/PEP-CTERM-associated repeat protein
VTRSWDGGGGTNAGWTTAANWSSDTEPVAIDTAEFDRGAAFSYTVTFPIPLLPFGEVIKTNQLIVGSNTVTFEAGRSNTNYHVAERVTREIGRGVLIGEEANDTAAALTSHLGLFSTAAATLGHVAGSSGTLTLNQNNDQFHVTGSSVFDTELIIGRYGTGVLSISGGADVSVPNESGNVSLGDYKASSGTASIHGAGSTFSVANEIVVGNAGNGTLNITDGGKLDNRTSSIGRELGSTGVVTVDGADSAWELLALVVGDSGTGTLNITAGGRQLIGSTAVVGTAFVGNSSTGVGQVTVNGAGSTFIAGLIDVANAGNGTIDVTGGGELRSTSAIIGSSPVGRGNVAIDGSGSKWTNSATFIVGTSGQGTVRVTAGGQLDTGDGGGFIGFHGGSEGAVTVDGMGSTWITTRSVHVGFNGAGSLTVTNGGTVQGLVLLVGTAGEIHGNGNLIGHVRNGGLVSPGTSPGALHIDGDYMQSAGGELLIELASDFSHDQLLVTGKATLDGTLQVALLNGFMPSVGKLFEVLHSGGGIVGAIASTTLPTLAPNLDWNVTYSNVAVFLQVISTLPGDYDQNGFVDAADYVVWRANVGAATLHNRDANSTGLVGQADYDFWRANFGRTAAASGSIAAGSAGAAVPEPTTLVWALAGLAIGMTLRCSTVVDQFETAFSRNWARRSRLQDRC